VTLHRSPAKKRLRMIVIRMDDGCPRCVKISEVWTNLEETSRILASLDARVVLAVEAGFEQGRLAGLLEAAGALDRAGFPDLARVVKLLIDEDLANMGKSLGEA